MSVKCWDSVAGAGQYPFSPSQYFMLPVPACWQYGHGALNQSCVNVGPPFVTLADIQCGAKHDRVAQLNTGLMLAQHRRWWTNISPALGQRLVFGDRLHDRLRERTDTK